MLGLEALVLGWLQFKLSLIVSVRPWSSSTWVVAIQGGSQAQTVTVAGRWMMNPSSSWLGVWFADPAAAPESERLFRICCKPRSTAPHVQNTSALVSTHWKPGEDKWREIMAGLITLHYVKVVQSQPKPLYPIHFGGLGQKQFVLIQATVLAHSSQLSNWTVKMIHWKALWLNTSTNWQDSLWGSGTTDALLIVWLKKPIKTTLRCKR